MLRREVNRYCESQDPAYTENICLNVMKAHGTKKFKRYKRTYMEQSVSLSLCPFYPLSLPGVHYCHGYLSELTLSNVLFCFVRPEVLARAPRGGRKGMHRVGVGGG